jgi:GNAT superfamily N-acetyltransferase
MIDFIHRSGALVPIAIRALSPKLLNEYLQFFDHDAFADNPDWGKCYCAFPHHDHAAGTWKGPLAGENRAAIVERICAGAMQGYLAETGGKVAGWCQAAPRLSFAALRGEPDPENDAPRTGSIVCFVVAKPYRGQGIAKALSQAACEHFRQQGLAFAEAYPRKRAESEAANHCGPLAMYLAMGFVPYREDDDSIIVRRALA